MKNKHIIFLIFAVVTFIRLIYINYLPLLGDEAYYWQWARHLDWGYYEQGPVVALVIWIFTFFTQINTVFTIRLGSVLLSLATMLIMYFTYKRFRPADKDDKENLINILLINASLIYAIGAVLMMHDTVMVFFYSLFLYNLTYLIKEPKKNSYWCYAGILLGLGIMSKLTMGTTYLGIIVFLLLTGTLKKYLKSFLLLSLFTFIFTLPYLYWNITHDFATAKYLLIRGGSQEAFTFKYFFELLFSQIGLISPLLFIVFIPVFLKNIKKSSFDLNFAFSTLFWVSIIPFFILSFKSRIEANWPVFTFLPLFFLASEYLGTLKPKLFKIISFTVIIPSIVLIALAYTQAVKPLIAIPEKNNPLNKSYGYKELATELDTIYASLSNKDMIFLASRHYQMASLLSFYMSKQPYFHILLKHESNKNYRFWNNDKELNGKNCLFVSTEPWESAEMSIFFNKRIYSKDFDVALPGHSVRKYHIDYFEGLKQTKEIDK